MIARCPVCLSTCVELRVEHRSRLIGSGYKAEMDCYTCGMMVYNDEFESTPNKAIEAMNSERIRISLEMHGLIKYDDFGNILYAEKMGCKNPKCHNGLANWRCPKDYECDCEGVCDERAI